MVEKIMQREEEERAEEGNRLFKLPKHIKQIGRGGNSPEIYIEDYAEGYLKRLAGSDYTECRVAVLVGEFIKAEGKRYVFIRGAIEAEDVMKENVPQFTSEIWAGVYEKIKRYFPQYEAVGWFLGGPGFLTEVTDTIRQTHVDWFGGRDRVLYKKDPVEKEDVFYLYDKGELKQWPGYCVYYERNEEMQDYLVAGAPPSVDDGYKEPVLEEIGKRVGRKEEPQNLWQEELSDNGRTEEGKERMYEKGAEKTTGKHGAGIAVAVALLAIGAFTLRETEKGGLPGNTGVLSPTPQGTEMIVTKPAEDSVQTHAEVAKSGETPEGEGMVGSIFEGTFIPVTEEPYRPGEERVTPTPEPKLSTPTPVPTSEPEKEEDVWGDSLKLYIVQNGDTLAGICRDFYGSTARMEEIKGINQILDENWIYAGQELYLP